MKFYDFEGKTLEEAKEKAKKELKVSDENLIIKNQNEKGGLFKKATITVTTTDEIVNYAKEILIEITKLMNIDIKTEIRRREKNIEIKMFSDKDDILIGKNGRTMTSLQTIIRQAITNQIETPTNIFLNVEDYKEKKAHNITWLAKKTARDVARTKIEVKLDRMNSYERRLVHEALANDKYVYTESVGEEPNRYLIIKPREEK